MRHAACGTRRAAQHNTQHCPRQVPFSRPYGNTVLLLVLRVLIALTFCEISKLLPNTCTARDLSSGFFPNSLFEYLVIIPYVVIIILIFIFRIELELGGQVR